MNTFSRISYREKLNENEKIAELKINPVDKALLTQKIAEYEKLVSSIPIWPFISLISWKLITTARKGQNNCTFKLSDLIKLSESSVDDSQNIITSNTLRTLRAALIDDYAAKLAAYYQSESDDVPKNYFKRMLWLYNHNRFSYGAKAHETAGAEWEKAIEIYEIDSSAVISIRDAVEEGYPSLCTSTKIIYNENSRNHDLVLGFDF